MNAVARRHGKLFRDRHHRHELRTPTETRNALVYIFFNDRKHAHANAHANVSPEQRGKITGGHALDPCSSALWFRDWDPSSHPTMPPRIDAPPTSQPQTWLARVGWQRGGRRGLLRVSESPY